jgi:acyl carrier protein
MGRKVSVPMSARLTIVAEIKKVAEEQNKKLAPLSDSLLLVDSGLDSLCFAILIARLEDALGSDPFTESDEITFPVTLGDLVRAYENAAQ